IFSGFDVEPFLKATNDIQLRRSYGLAPDDLVIAELARLSPLKGHADLLAVAEKLAPQCPEARFLLIGDGPLRPWIEREISRRGLGHHFVFAGLAEPSKVPPLLGIADALLHLSRREGLPRALPQAMAAAKPVLAYRLDG